MTHLPYYYEEADIDTKHSIIGSIFTKNLILEENKFRNVRENSLISLISSNTGVLRRNIKGQAINFDGLSNLAPHITERCSQNELVEYRIIRKLSV